MNIWRGECPGFSGEMSAVGGRRYGFRMSDPDVVDAAVVDAGGIGTVVGAACVVDAGVFDTAVAAVAAARAALAGLSGGGWCRVSGPGLLTVARQVEQLSR